MIIKKLTNIVSRFWYRRTNNAYLNYLRKKGVKIGESVFIRKDTVIDLTRPSLVEIGNNVRFGINFTLFTHDFATVVFLQKYKEFIPSSGRVKIGSNVYFGVNCSVLKGVTIGDNCIIGAGSIIMKDIPANSVASGIPAKVVCTLGDYYDKRKKKSIEEAFDYARSIKERYNRRPTEADFFEEFPLFVNGDEIDKYPMIPFQRQLTSILPHWRKNHKAIFDSFEDFLKAAGV